MILTSEERAKQHVASGAWNHVTLYQMFKRTVASRRNEIAFEDIGPSAIPGLSSRLTFTDAERRVDGLAAFFAGIGLKADMVIGIHLPPCVDASVIVLAAMRAGLVVCPLPVYWSKAEIEAAVEAASIKAIVTASEIEDDPSGEMVRDVAAETFAIRFVFAVGAGLPDGLIDLAEVLADVEALGPPPEIQRRGQAAEHVALLSMAKSADDKLLIVPYSHNQLMAIGVGHLLEGGIAGSDTLLSTMHPASLASVGGALATALLSGSTVAFHHGTSLAGLVEAVEVSAAKRVILPEAMGPALSEYVADDIAFSLVGTGLGFTRPEAIRPERATLDLITLGGLCLIPRARDADGEAVQLFVGPTRMGRNNDAGPVIYETRVKPRIKAGDRRATLTQGELHLTGAIIPDAPWPEPHSGKSGAMLAVTSDGYLRTGLQVEVHDERLVILGSLTETIQVAGTTVSPARLDELFKRHPQVQDAAVFPIEAGPVGNRLGVAVVPKPGEYPKLLDILIWLDGEKAGALDRPVSVIAVPEIPRAADGAVLRQALFMQAVA
ncbi:AMP-binding protein [Oryzibacter oryziterrae]|uniref:AMP-binding protein n=1 Tax=Oryzibacter oryziterrae TaxID=2766474 RepID=UPI001F3AA502|nr:class I adenylate-forming enzyme family protein [Oryzibacter oryziterrae]